MNLRESPNSQLKFGTTLPADLLWIREYHREGDY